jgi:hypothetical protein
MYILLWGGNQRHRIQTVSTSIMPPLLSPLVPQNHNHHQWRSHQQSVIYSSSASAAINILYKCYEPADTVSQSIYYTVLRTTSMQLSSLPRPTSFTYIYPSIYTYRKGKLIIFRHISCSFKSDHIFVSLVTTSEQLVRFLTTPQSNCKQTADLAHSDNTYQTPVGQYQLITFVCY